jgi:DNA-binding transcriptional ArsR family regulator
LSESVAKEDQGKKIEELSQRIAQLEDALRQVSKPYTEVVAQLAAFQGTVQRYFHLLDLYQKHGVISIDTILPQVKDPMSKEVLRILLDKPGLNISEITDRLREERGSASRRIVRERLASLVEAGVLVERTDKGEKTFEISEAVVRKWSQVLGLSKYDEHADESPGETNPGDKRK